jgi:hypothetical protein
MPWDGNGGWLGSWLLGAKQKDRKSEKAKERKESGRKEGGGFVKSGRNRGR